MILGSLFQPVLLIRLELKKLRSKSPDKLRNINEILQERIYASA